MSATIFERLFALISALVTLLGSFSFSTNFERADDEIKFTINANTVISEELPKLAECFDKKDAVSCKRQRFFTCCLQIPI